MEIRVKPVSELTPVEYRACYRANYGEDGYMQSELYWCKRGQPGTVVMLWDGPDDTVKSLIGWCLLTPVRMYGLLTVTRYVMGRSKYTAQFWVKRQYRRKGYGKTLMNEVKKLDPNPHVLPHDGASSELFSGYKCQVLAQDKNWIKRGKPKVA